MPATMEAVQVPYMPWDRFVRQWNWRQGQHVTLVGTTGRGKTTLTNAIIPYREWILFLGTKRVDRTQNALVSDMGFKRVSDPREINPEIGKRFLVQPPFPRNASVAQLKALHARIFRETLMRAFRQGGWTIILDEVRYLSDTLGLAGELELLWLQGRSLGVSMVAGTQRPRHIPLEAYSQASYLFLWNNSDQGDVQRIAEITGVKRAAVIDVVPQLEKHDVLFISTQPDGRMLVTTAPPA